MSDIGKYWELEFSPVEGYVTEAKMGEIIDFNFSVKVVRKPEEDTGGDSTGSSFVPPKPVILEAYSIDEFTGIERVVSIDNTSATIDLLGIVTTQYFPFKKILFRRDNEEFEVIYTNELYNEDRDPLFDIVTSYVPSDIGQKDIKFSIVVKTTSEYVQETQEYTIRIFNDWDKVKIELEEIMKHGQEFVVSSTPPTTPVEPIDPPTNKVVEENPSDSSVQEPIKPTHANNDDKERQKTVDDKVKDAKSSNTRLTKGGESLLTKGKTL